VTTSTNQSNSRSGPAWVLVLASVASLMVALDTLVVSTALTTIRLDLGASIEQLEWTVNAYTLTLAVLLLPAAALGDRFGRRRVFTAGLGLFVAASAASALAPDAGSLIAARAVQGAGAALVITNALALVSAAVAAERRGSALGILQGITGLAVVGGPVIGGAVAEGIAWEWIFWLNVPIGLAAIPLALVRIHESLGHDTALDIGGVALVTGGVLGIVWGLVRGNAAGWDSPEVIAALAIGAALLVGFVWWELRAHKPMLPMRFFRLRAFSSGNAGVFFLFASLFGAVFFLSQFLQTTLGYDPLEAGLRLMPWTATLFVVAPIAGALADRIGERPLLVGGAALQGVGMGWVALIAEPGLGYGELLAPLIVAGIGVSMAIPPAASAVVGSVAHDEVGKAAGANSMLRELGGVFGIAVLVTVFAGTGSYASAEAFSDGFAPAIGISAALSLLAAIAGVGLPGRHQHTAAATGRPQPLPALEAAGRG
jgi:EmrB/QacA subfamily drug resistance transporter